MGRVIIVDDEPDMRLALRLFLERCGHEVEEASSGDEILAKLRGSPPDLVLLDMRMPGPDGLQTLGKIRESNKELPVIMMTGYGSPQAQRDALQQGANEYILKPFKHEELLEAMSKVGVTEKRRPVPLPAVKAAEFIRSVSASRFSYWVRHFLLKLRQAKEVFFDRWRHPPLQYERDPSLEEKIALTFSIITDPIRVFFDGLFDPDYDPFAEEAPMGTAKEEPEPEEPVSSQPPRQWTRAEEPTEAPPAAPVRRSQPPAEPIADPGIEQVQRDLASQIQVLSASLHGEIEKLAAQVQQRPEAGSTVGEAGSARLQETPQEEFRRLLITIQTTMDQSLHQMDGHLNGDYEMVNEWLRSVSELRQAVDRSQAA